MTNLNALDDFSFCTQILPQVSRTFAINIGYLGNECYKAVLISYLFCRIIDTIEDSNKISFEFKIEWLNTFHDFFPFKSDWKSSLEKLIQDTKPYNNLTDNEHETTLLNNSLKVFNELKKLDQEAQAIIEKYVKEMAKGMAKFQSKPLKEKSKSYTVKNIPELENYCYYVAGVVGLLLKDLFIHYYPNIPKKSQAIMEKTCIDFGLGLQMTNIIKDFRDDSKRDWCYLPLDLLNKYSLTPEGISKLSNKENISLFLNDLINHTQHKLDQALDYTLAIPRHLGSLRIFCLLPLHFARQTLVKAKHWSKDPSNEPIKITRNDVKKTILFTNLTFYSNSVHKLYYNQYQ